MLNWAYLTEYQNKVFSLSEIETQRDRKLGHWGSLNRRSNHELTFTSLNLFRPRYHKMGFVKLNDNFDSLTDI